MKQKFDFVIDDDKSFHRDIFRFYPRRTHVHGFRDAAPKTWDGVYKVYYSWAIIRQYYDDDMENKIESSEILLDMSCDECSQLPNLPEIIKNVMNTGESFNFPTFGQPAGDWRIEQRICHKYGYDEADDKDYEFYDYEVFNNWLNVGYRFTLNKEETLKFCNWLDKINRYALEHGQGI